VSKLQGDQTRGNHSRSLQQSQAQAEARLARGRLAGVDIPNDKRVLISLTYIHGIGRSTSERLLRMANVNPETRVKELGDEEFGRLRQVLDRLSTDKEILIEGRSPARGWR